MPLRHRLPQCPLLVLGAVYLVFALCLCFADPPRMVNFQGRVTVNGTNFDGVGQFRFVLVDAGREVLQPPNPPAWMYRTYWSHDGSSSGGSAPVTSIAIPVAKGLYSVNLGDTSINNMNQPLPPSVFTNTQVYLRVWFDDGVHGVEQLVPDQRLASAPYALLSGGVESGGVTTTMLADGAVTGNKIQSGTVKSFHIDDGGATAYDGFYERMKVSSQSASPLPFSGLTLVSATNGVPPSLLFTLDGAAFGTVLGFIGREGISEPYEYVVEVIAPRGDLPPPNTQLGRQARLRFVRNERATSFSGVISGCSVASYDGTSALYTFRIGSAIDYLALSADYRVYQDRTVPEIAADIYATASSNALSLSLSGTHDPRECTIQYGEANLNFFSRLLEEEGIFYLFRLQSSQPALVLGDNPAAFSASANPQCSYFGDMATNLPVGAEYIRSFQKASRDSTRTTRLDSYDFTRPAVDLMGTASSPEGRGEVYQFGSPARTAAGNTMLAGLRQERQAVERAKVSGTANVPDVRAGHTFALDDRTGSGLDGEYLAVSVRHAGFRRLTNGVATFYYGNQFEAIPANVSYRPALKTPKPMARTSTANVTGPAGEQVYTDRYGRVKVQFHWDRRGANNENASGWIRVATPMAGAGHSMLFLPRVGDEVLVEFVNGDPDQPVVIGSLHNALATTPLALPESKWSGIIKSTSTAGGVNQIRFDDTAGAEALDITASRLLINSVLGTRIGSSGGPQAALEVNGAVWATAFQGNGSALSSLSASAVTGILNDARLSTNIARLDANQRFTGVNIFGQIGVGGATSSDMLNVHGDARLNDFNLFLRSDADANHGLGWFGYAKTFAGQAPDGPVLFGCVGGGLGTVCNNQLLALTWDNNGRVTVDPGNLNNGSLAPGLTFGSTSGEGIASKRTPGGNQYGLDFYTAFTNRLTILNNGNVGIGVTNPVRRLQVGDPGANTGSIQVGRPAVGGEPKLIYFGDSSFVYLGENGADDTMELRATRFYFKDGFLGLGVGFPSYQLHLSSNSAAKPSGGSWADSSDARLKTDIQPMTGALEKLACLQGVTFQWRNPEAHGNQAGLQGGFVAQQVEQHFPSWVKEVPASPGDQGLTPDGQVKSMALPFEFDALVVEAIKELKSQNESLQKENEALKRSLADLKTAVEGLLRR